MRKIKYLFIAILFSYACSQPKKNKSINIQTPSVLRVEKFTAFIDKFKNDSLFQVLRIDNPLIIETIDDDSEVVKFNKSLKRVSYVSFLPESWKTAISITNSQKAVDTVVVELQGVDTGIVIDHYFVLRNNQWFLYKIRNLSD